MKNNTIYSIGFALIFFFSFILQGTIIITNEQCGMNNSNAAPPLTASNSVTYKWYCTWGGGSDDYGWGVVVDSSGNIYIAGYTFSFGAGMEDIVLVKYNKNGRKQWNRMWGGVSSDVCWGIEVDSLGNIYLVGSTWSFGAEAGDMVLVKYDENGVQQWYRTWGGGNSDRGRGVAVDSSGNIYLAGYTRSFGAGYDDLVLVKYDGNGVQQWYRTWGGVWSDYGHGVAVDSSGNIYLAGFTSSFGAGVYDMVLVKYDGNGVQQWNRTWGGGSADQSYGATVDSSDNIYLAGYTWSFGAGSSDIVLVKYDGNGVQQWYRTWGGNDEDEGYRVVVNSTDNIYLVGTTWSFGAGSSDMVLVKYDRNGVQQWSRTWGGVNLDSGRGTAVDSSDNIYLAGSTTSFGAGGYDMVLVKLGSDRPPNIISYVIIVILITSLVGIGIAITFFIKKRWKIVR